ncbi:hypothetical protein X777_01577, partial [Ooceraea biroi]
VAGATTGAGVGLPLLLLVVALLDDLTRATTATPAVLQPLNSVHHLAGDVATSVHVASRPSDRPFAARLFRKATSGRASSSNGIDFEHRNLPVLTPVRDDEGEEIAARRGRAKRVPISERTKLKDQPSPNFIDSWPATWRRVAEQPRKVESAPTIDDDGIGPAVRGAFTPLLEPVFKFGESVLRPESSLRDILLREGASRTATTTATAVATRTIARDVVYPGYATQRAGSSLPERDDVGGVTEDGVAGDKDERELVLVRNEGNSAVVAGSGGSVIEWTTTTVAGPMSASAFSGDDVQVAERIRARASSERSSPKAEEDDDGLINTTEDSDRPGDFHRFLGCVATYITGIRGRLNRKPVEASSSTHRRLTRVAGSPWRKRERNRKDEREKKRAFPCASGVSARNADDFCVVRRHAGLISRWIGTRVAHTRGAAFDGIAAARERARDRESARENAVWAAWPPAGRPDETIRDATRRGAARRGAARRGAARRGAARRGAARRGAARRGAARRGATRRFVRSGARGGGKCGHCAGGGGGGGGGGGAGSGDGGGGGGQSSGGNDDAGGSRRGNVPRLRSRGAWGTDGQRGRTRKGDGVDGAAA